MKIHLHRKGLMWWYISIGDWQPFTRFDHSAWICLHPKWLVRFWNGCHDCPKPTQETL